MENEFNTLQTNVTNEVDTLEGIVKGRNQARVFNTTADMEAWLKDQKNKGVCNVGDNLYIVALDVPDWWISEVLDTPDANTGYYYKIAKLEVQKVDLTNIESDIDTLQSDVNTLESEVDVIQGKISNLEGVDLIASAVEVDDTNLGLGKNNVQEVLEELKSALEWKLITSDTYVNKPSVSYSTLNSLNFRELMITVSTSSNIYGMSILPRNHFPETFTIDYSHHWFVGFNRSKSDTNAGAVDFWFNKTNEKVYPYQTSGADGDVISYYYR